MNLINESLEKIIKGTDIVEHKEVKVVDKKMQKLLQEAINNVNLRNCKTSHAKTVAYQRALQEAIEKVNPDKCWHEITNCDIYNTLLECKNDTDAVIERILVESKAQPKQTTNTSSNVRKTLNEGKSIVKKQGKKSLAESKRSRKSLKEHNFDTNAWPRYRFEFEDGFELAAKDSDEAEAMYQDILDNRHLGAPRSIEELDDVAYSYYENEDEFSFNYFSDDELSLLWKNCILTGAAYDDEVYEAISNRPNKDEIFHKFDKEIQDSQDNEARLIYGAENEFGSDFDKTESYKGKKPQREGCHREKLIKESLKRKFKKVVSEALKKSNKRKNLKEGAMQDGNDAFWDIVERAKLWIDDADQDTELEDCVNGAIDDGLIYTDDIIGLAAKYGVIDTDQLVQDFYEELWNDIYSEVSDYYEDHMEELKGEETEKESLGKHVSGKKVVKESKSLKEADDFVIFEQEPDDWYGVDFDDYEGDVVRENGIVITGNRDFIPYGDEELIKIINGDYEDDDLWNDETGYYDDYDVFEELKKVTGKDYAKSTIRGIAKVIGMMFTTR